MMANIISQSKVLFYCFNVSGVPAASRRRAFQGSAIAPLDAPLTNGCAALPIPNAVRGMCKMPVSPAKKNLPACLHAERDVQKVQLAVVELVETTIFSAMVISAGGS